MTTPAFREDVPLRPASWAVLAALCLLPVGGAIGVALAADTRALPLAALVLIVPALIVFFAILPNRVVVAGSELRLRAGLARYRLPITAVDASSLAEIDLTVRAALRPRWRLFGTALPGPFQAGWFGLAGGGKAFVLLNRHDRVILLEPRDGDPVLLSLADAAAFRRAISRG